MNSRQCYVQKVPSVSEYFTIAFGSFRQFSGGYPTKFYTGRLGPEGQPVSLLYIIFDRKGPPFVYPLLTVGTPFRNLVSKVAPLLTSVNALPLKYCMKITQNQEIFSTFSQL